MKREAIRVLIIDGQGGGMGRGLVEAVKKRWPALHLRAVGTNSMATAAMLRAGADEGATGENAVIFNAKWAHVMMGPHRCADTQRIAGRSVRRHGGGSGRQRGRQDPAAFPSVQHSSCGGRTAAVSGVSG